MSTVNVGVAVSRVRFDLPSFIDVAVTRLHESGSLAVVFNDALAEAREHGQYAFKIDPDCTYPADHPDLFGDGMVWGIGQAQGCDGSDLGRRRMLAASQIPTDTVVRTNRYGQVTGSFPAGPEVETGVVAEYCPARWSWGTQPKWLRRIECDH